MSIPLRVLDRHTRGGVAALRRSFIGEVLYHTFKDVLFICNGL